MRGGARKNLSLSFLEEASGPSHKRSFTACAVIDGVTYPQAWRRAF